MTDPTETIRREMVAEINSAPASREVLEAKHGQVWDKSELLEEFEVLTFMAPIVVVKRRTDGVRGSLELQHQPRLYYHFTEE